ncbi:putative inactive peptidyl-prolyl cis-trans isomerase-like 6 [Thoreauomyces humboldtii]|nr:putative inactive peptidyl-prolyl cis-trans isomerase-like 6 [Thoreauomyces humboldtii]
MPAHCTLPITTFSPAAAATKVSKVVTEKLILVGIVSSPDFYHAKTILEKLNGKPHTETMITPVTETEFRAHRHGLLAVHSDLIPAHHPSHVLELHVTSVTTTTTANKHRESKTETIKSLISPIELAERESIHVDETVDRVKVAKEAYQDFLASRPGPVVTWEFWSDGEDEEGKLSKRALGRVVVELEKGTCPKTVDRFLKFVEGGVGSGYERSRVSRIVKGGWIECGEILDKDGHPISVPPLEDENFIHEHKPYTLSYIPSSSGPHSTTTPFLITLAAMPRFDKRCVAFGKVLEGAETLEKCGAVRTTHERPVDEVWVQEIKVWKRSEPEAEDGIEQQ